VGGPLPSDVWFDFRDVYAEMRPQDDNDDKVENDAHVITDFIRGYDLLVHT
jgi:hypothetical protein